MIDERFKERKTILVLRHVLKFCRLVRRPGLKQDHSELERDLRGSARVYSKALVEENKNERTKAR